ncbi:MAG: aldose 1-epimerase family protein [Burkholderiales bacterium]
MTTLYGLPLAEVIARTGHLGQLARIDWLSEENGPARGARRLRLITGGGLEVDLHPDRALDLGQVTANGVPLAWMSPAGIAHPGLYDAHGSYFARTFGGGLMATCGLDHFGPPGTDDGQSFGLHGRVGAVPATLTRAGVDGDHLVVEGVVRQAAVLFENIEMRRTIRSEIGSMAVTLTDTITNCGGADQPHMILYHFNFGWPLLSEHARLGISSIDVIAQRPEAENDAWMELAPPRRGYRERVYLHRLRNGRAHVTLENPKIGLGVSIRFESAVLPALAQWKMLGEREYVLGLEPTNVANLSGRASARAASVLPTLAPGQSVTYALEFEVWCTRVR